MSIHTLVKHLYIETNGPNYPQVDIHVVVLVEPDMMFVYHVIHIFRLWYKSTCCVSCYVIVYYPIDGMIPKSVQLYPHYLLTEKYNDIDTYYDSHLEVKNKNRNVSCARQWNRLGHVSWTLIPWNIHTYVNRVWTTPEGKSFLNVSDKLQHDEK